MTYEEYEKYKKKQNNPVTSSSNIMKFDDYDPNFQIENRAAEGQRAIQADLERMRQETELKKIKEQEKEKNKFIKKGKGNFFQKVGATAADIAGNVAIGSLNAFEGLSDFAQYRAADALDFFGADKKAANIRDEAKYNNTQGIIDSLNHITSSDLSETKPEEKLNNFNFIEDYSVMGEKGDSLSQGVGNAATSAILSTMTNGGVGLALAGASAAGGAQTEAYAEGANDIQAGIYGILNGATEAGSEMLFGGLGKITNNIGFGTGALDDQIVNAFTKKMSNTLVKNLTTLGIKSAGEGVEEVLSGLGSAIAKKMTYMQDEDIKKLIKDQKLMDSFVMGLLTSGVMQVPSTIRYSAQGRDINTGLTGIQQKYVNEIAQQRIEEAQRRNIKLSGYEKGKIEQRALTDYQHGRLVDTSKLPLRTQDINLPGLKTNTRATTTSNVKGMDLQQSAYYYGFNPNSEAVVSAKAMLDNRGIKSRFDADAFKNNNANALWTNNNGVREVVFNPNANEQTILEEIAIHELTHDLMSSENSNKVLNHKNIIDYVSKLDGYKESRTKLENLYAKQLEGKTSQEKIDYINEEVVADVIGKNIGSQEYIRRLIDKEPSIAKNIYDWVVNKVTNSKGVKNEKAYWNNVKNNFEKAYNMSYNSTNQVDTRLKQRYPNIDNIQTINYNNLNPEIIPYIATDERKSKFTQYGQNKSFYELDYETMEKAIAIGSKAALEAQSLGLDSYSFNDDNYIYDFDILNKENNTFGITNVEKIKDISEELNFNEGTTSKDSGLPNEEYELYKRPNNNDNQSTRDSRTSNQIVELDKNPRNTNLVRSENEIKRNKQKELDNSSFSLDNKAKRYDDLTKTNYLEYFRKDNGDVRVNLMDTNNNLINQIDLWSNTEAVKQFGEKLGSRLYETATDYNNKIEIGNDINNLGEETDYFMNHRPTETGLTADDLTNENTESPMPKDMYEHPEWYFQMNEKYSKESMNIIRQVKGKPNAVITIYRATPGNKINPGDWVTLSKAYAELHNNSQFNGKANILEMKVKARDVQFAGDDINEFGYYPNGDIKNSISNQTWQSFLDNNFKTKGTKTRLGDIKLPGLQNAIQEEVQNQTQQVLLPITNELKELNNNLNKVLNPNEISKLTPQNANTTPILPGINRNKVGDGKSKFFDNIKDKTNMLNEEQKSAILNDEDVKYYDKVTNKDSLDKAFGKLEEEGQSESLRWFNKPSENADATDVAEGWILLKQYADSGDTDGMVEVAKKLRDMGTKAGQTVQAFNILSRLTPEGMVKYAQSELSEAYDKMVKNKSAKWIEANRSKFDLQPNEVQFIMDTMKEVSTMEDGYDKRFKLAQIQKVLTDKLPPAKGAGMKSWMRVSMLFNPKTQVRNVVGNALIAPINAFGDMFASLTDKIIGAKTGVRTTGNFNLKNYASGMKKGLYESYNDFENGVNTRNIEGNRFEISEGKSFDDNKAIGKALNKVDSLLSFMLDAGDRGFYEASFVNSINNQMVLNNTTEVTQDMIDIATQEALSRTWQDNNEYTKFVLGVRNMLNKANVGGYGLGDVLIPFAKTPANLTKAIVDYSPVGLISTLNKGIKLNRSLTNGQYSAKIQHEFVQSLGKATAGTMLYILGLALAKAGITSGESDEDKDVANFLKNTLGINSYSVKIGDKSFTYDWAQPLAAPLAITSNLVQKQKNEASLLENITSTLNTAGNLLLEQSFMESISTVLNNNEGIATGIQEAILDLPARSIPTLSKQIVDLTDGTQRQTFVKDKPIESMVNSIKAKLPGLSQTLAPSVDTMGRDIQKYGGKNNIFNVFLNPANVNTKNISKGAQEIYRLYKETGETNIMPRVAPYYINQKGEKINFSTQQRAKYQKTSGKIIEESVEKLIDNDSYKNLTNVEQAEAIKNIVDYSYNVAKKETLNIDISDTYKKAYEYSHIGDVVDFYTFKANVDGTNSETKRKSTISYLTNSSLTDEQIGYLYKSQNYSTEEEINNILSMNIPIKEFIKYDATNFKADKDENGNSINGSVKNKNINFINSLSLSIPQKAILIKQTYPNFNDYNEDIVNYIKRQKLTVNQKSKLLIDLGFEIRGGRVYW